jgi:hypothetical protein
MEIQKTSATQNIISDSPNPQRDFSKLPSGSSLNAVVIDKADDNTYTLKLSDGQLVRAHTQNELLPGQLLKLEVVKTGSVSELKIVWPAPIAQTTQFNIQNVLRQILPKQVELTDFALALRQFANLTSEKSNPLSALIQQTLGTLPSKEDLMTAEGLKQGINNSGVFLEAKIAQQLTLQGDVKGQLLALADTLQKAPLTQVSHSRLAQATTYATADKPEQSNSLLSKTEGAIARIVLDQLVSLPQNNEPQNTWQIGIPFTDGVHTDAVKLKITQEGRSNRDPYQSNWSVVIELNPPGMGIIHCKISLIDNKVDTYFWGDFQSSILQVQENLDLLANRYAEAGLAVGNLNVVDGARIASEIPEKKLMRTLLDDFA